VFSAEDAVAGAEHDVGDGDQPTPDRGADESFGVVVSVDRLSSFLAAADADVRAYAARQLGALAVDSPSDVHRVRSALLDRLDDDHGRVRARAADALATLAAADPDAFAADVAGLADTLADDRADVAAAAADALASVAEADPAAATDVASALATYLVDAESAVAARALAAVAAADPDAVAPATDALADALTFASVDAADALASVAAGDPDAVAAVAPAVADAIAAGPPVVRRDLTAALATVAPTHPDAVTPHAPLLEAALGDDDRAVSGHATTALAAVADVAPGRVAESTDALVTHLSAQDPAVRVDAARALAAVAATDHAGVGDAPASLAARLADEDEAVRRAAANALAVLAAGDGDAIAPFAVDLAAALDDPDDAVRDAVADALAAVAETEPTAVADSVDALVDGLDDAPPVREPLADAIVAVAEHDPDVVAEHVDALAAHLTVSGIRKPLADAVTAVARDAPVDVDVDALAAALDAEDAWEAGYAARSLVDAAGAATRTLPPALALVVDRLDDDAAAVRTAAAADLVALADDTPHDLVPAVPALVDALDDETAAVREGVACALAAVAAVAPDAIRRTDSVGPLVDALADTTATSDAVGTALDAVAAANDVDAPRGVRPFVAFLLDRVDDASPVERRRAALSLSHVSLSDAELAVATRALTAAVSDDVVRAPAARTLASLAVADHAPLDRLLGRVADDDPRAALAVAAMASFEPLVADPSALTDATVSTDPVVRRRATRALAAVARDREDATTATGVLLDYADAANPDVRSRAARELGRHGLARPDDARGVVATVATLLEADDDSVRRYAAVALASVAAADPAAVDTVAPPAPDGAHETADSADAGDSPDAWLAHLAAFVRARSSADLADAARTLAAHHDDDRPAVRAVAALATGTFETTCPRHLVDALADDAVVVRAASARAIAAITERDPTAAASLVARLVDALDDDPAVTAAVCRALAAVATAAPGAISPAGLDAVAQRLAHADPRVQVAAMRVVGRVDPDAYADALEARRTHGPERVRDAAAAVRDDPANAPGDAGDDAETSDDARLARTSPRGVIESVLSTLTDRLR
jgi:hypothetical protein